MLNNGLWHLRREYHVNEIIVLKYSIRFNPGTLISNINGIAPPAPEMGQKEIWRSQNRTQQYLDSMCAPNANQAERQSDLKRIQNWTWWDLILIKTKTQQNPNQIKWGFNGIQRAYKVIIVPHNKNTSVQIRVSGILFQGQKCQSKRES
jgi:hypothetical protein